MQIGIAIVVLLCVFAFSDWKKYDSELIVQIEQEYGRRKKRRVTVFGEGEYFIGSGLLSNMKIHTENKLCLLLTVYNSDEIILRVLQGVIYYRGEAMREGSSLYLRDKDILKSEDGTVIYVDKYKQRKRGD